MPRKIVNCYRGARLIGSYVIDQGVTRRGQDLEPPEAFIETAKSRLSTDGFAQEPFLDVNFVIRDCF